MCGRFDLHSEYMKLVKEFRIDSSTGEYRPSYNIAPSRRIIIVKEEGRRHMTECRWGFLPSWTKDPSMGHTMINARAETVAVKPAFKDAFRRQRCLVVADGFYEWKREGRVKTPVYIRLKSQRPIGFASLYNTWTSPAGEKICTCTIITTEANELLKPIHDRMPVIIPKESEDLWLDPNTWERERLLTLLRPYPSEEMEWYEVAPLVNKPGYDAPEAIVPV